MHGWVSAGKPSSPPVFMIDQLQPIPAFPTPHPDMDFPGGCAWEKGTWSQSMSHTFLPPPPPEAAIQRRAWQLPRHGHRPLFSSGIQWVGTPFPRGNGAPYFIAWTACGSGGEQRERKGGVVGYFPCRQWPCVLYSLCLAREVGIFFSNLDNPTSEEKQRESVHSCLLSCQFSHNCLPLAKPAKCLISFLIKKNNCAYLQVDLMYCAQTIITTPVFYFLWLTHISFSGCCMKIFILMNVVAIASTQSAFLK